MQFWKKCKKKGREKGCEKVVVGNCPMPSICSHSRDAELPSVGLTQIPRKAFWAQYEE
jgi:hypothetical protein